MAQRASRTTSMKNGFTIVELLIVVVVIAILAAITIVAYNGIQNRAKASAAQLSAKQAGTKIQSYAIQNADLFPSDLATAGISNTDSTSYQYRVDNNANPRSFCITTTTNKISYYVSNTTSSPTAGACSGHGLNGASAITNLVTNPGAEENTTNTSGNGSISTVSRDTTWSASGSASFLVAPTSTSSNDSYMNIGGGDQSGGFRAGLEAGKTYTISGTIRLSAPLTGSIRAQALKIVAYYKIGTSITARESAQAPNAAGQTRLTVTLAIPSTGTEAWLRFYNGTTSGGGNVWWDNLMITEGDTTYSYADGFTDGWIWNGTPNNSTSTGTPQ